MNPDYFSSLLALLSAAELFAKSKGVQQDKALEQLHQATLTYVAAYRALKGSS